MPTYDYECVQCEHRFEIQCKISEHKDTAVCPECGGQAEQKIFETPAFSLEGTDWPGKRNKMNSTARGR